MSSLKSIGDKPNPLCKTNLYTYFLKFIQEKIDLEYEFIDQVGLLR